MIETFQKNMYVEGTISSNYSVESLNTKLFKDIGSGNNIIIEIKGYKNGKSNQIIADSYDFIKDIPIKILKNGDMTENVKLNFKISNLGQVPLVYRDINNKIQTNFSPSLLKDGDKIEILIQL